MNVEEIRLQTFSNWPDDAPVEPSRIAKGGFFATGNGMEVQCNWCGTKITEWQYGDQVNKEFCIAFLHFSQEFDGQLMLSYQN